MISTTRREFLQATASLPLLPIIFNETQQEKVEIAYKVVTHDMWSHAYWRLDNAPIKYETNKWANPNPGQGKLFVFSDLVQAKCFIETYYNRGTSSPRIFKCLCLDITEHLYDTCEDKQWWPIGTVFASKVKLIEEII